MTNMLQVRDLHVTFVTPDRTVHAVNGVSFDLQPGQTLGIVGESGSGKSQSVLAMMGLLAKNGKASGEALYNGQNLLTMSPKQLNGIRGDRADGLYLRNFTTQIYEFNAIYVIETDGYVFDRLLSRWVDEDHAAQFARTKMLLLLWRATMMYRLPLQAQGGKQPVLSMKMWVRGT